MEQIELTLQDIQQEMFNVVIKIDEICKELNIKYSLAYGSLIGAIRHGGFIPWDDDLDIWMTKRDLDIFTNYCIKHEDDIKPFKICTRKNTKNYSYNIPRFANIDYKYVNTDIYQSMFDLGIFVDIYPIEGYGDSIQEAKKIFKQCDYLNKLYYIYISPFSKKNKINTFIKKIISFGLHLIYKDEYYLHQEKKFDNLLKKYSNCDFVGCPRWTPNMVLYKRNDVLDLNGELKTVKHVFNNCYLDIIENYDQVLKADYGNYMELPAEKDRAPHHSYKIYKRSNN